MLGGALLITGMIGNDRTYERKTRPWRPFKIVAMVTALFVAVTCVAAANGVGRGYSDGVRVGQVYKLSRKGLIWKSWEAEMLSGQAADQPGAPAVRWEFTIRDPAVVAEAREAQTTGKTTKVTYVEWLMSPVTMDSDYEAVVIELPQPHAAPWPGDQR
jgi:hypothetical protein